MNFRKCFAVICTLNLLSSVVQAAADPAQVAQLNAQLTADSNLLSGWMSNQLKYTVPFNSTSGNVVPKQISFLGFEVGVEGVVSGTKMDTDGLHHLNTGLVDANSIDTFSRLPMPLILGHAKIGLPLGFDAGIRFGGIPKTDENSGDSKGSIKNKVIGFDLRKKIVDEGMLRPFGVTLGFNYTHADGSLDVTNTYDSQSIAVTGGSASVQNGATTEHADWNTNSYGLQAIVDKQIAFITPYIGASVNRNTGDIHNSITTTGVPVVNGTADPSQPLFAVGTSTDKANKWDCRALLGIEFSVLPFLRLGLHGEYAGNKNMAGALGLRVQFH